MHKLKGQASKRKLPSFIDEIIATWKTPTDPQTSYRTNMEIEELGLSQDAHKNYIALEPTRNKCKKCNHGLT